jgi:PAP2 superfamily
MANSNFNPGAWLSGNGGTVWSPPVDTHGAKTMPPVGQSAISPPIDRHGARTMPPVGPPNSWMPPVGPPRPPARLMSMMADPNDPNAPFPWLGIDPSWVYDGGDMALRAQALRKMRLRVAPFEDPREVERSKAGVVPDPSSKDTLWRWDEPFRIKAAVAELSARLVVEKFSLWSMPTPSGSSAIIAPQELLEVVPPAKGFDYSLQIDKVLRAAIEREDRMPEILVQVNDIDCFFDAITGIDRANAPHLRELIVTAAEVATMVVMSLKHNIAEWRPVQRSGRVQPAINTPGHGSMPSGHATIAVLTAKLLSALLYQPRDLRAASLDRLSQRIAFNRVVAGLHYPMDSFVGEALGAQLAKAMVALAVGDALPAKPAPVEVMPDSELKEYGPPGSSPPKPSPAPPPPNAAAPSSAARAVASAAAKPPGGLWARMWQAAQKEVKGLRV